MTKLPFSENFSTAPGAAQAPSLLLRLGDENHRVTGGAGSAVAPCPVTATVPHAPPWLIGVAVYKGEALPVVDLAAVLGGDPAPVARGRARMLVSRAGGLAVAWAVDDVDGDDGHREAHDLDLDALGRRLLADAGCEPWPVI